jgi:ubiquinone/menaquinone biosynthesis C-methylase UbiE
MKLSRKTASKIRLLLDEYLPPALRDSRWFVRFPLRLVFGDKAHVFLDFKQRALTMSDEEFAAVYRDIKSNLIERETDLTDACAEAVQSDVVGPQVLEVGCGKGLLAAKMSERWDVTAVDIALDDSVIAQNQKVRWATGDVEDLQFPDASFDTVVCTHTLEHVRNLTQALAELRRVARHRLIVVVPKQRPYRYTFDLHLSFFPYAHSLQAAFGTGRHARLEEIDRDWYCVEDRDAA